MVYFWIIVVGVLELVFEGDLDENAMFDVRNIKRLEGNEVDWRIVCIFVACEGCDNVAAYGTIM